MKTVKKKKKKKSTVLTTGCNDVLVIVPWNWPLNHYSLVFYRREGTWIGDGSYLGTTSLVPRNMSTAPVLQIPMKARCKFDPCCAFNPKRTCIICKKKIKTENRCICLMLYPPPKKQKKKKKKFLILHKKPNFTHVISGPSLLDGL